MAGWVEVSRSCSLGDLAGLETNEKENKHCILFLPLRKEIFKKEKIKKNNERISFSTQNKEQIHTTRFGLQSLFLYSLNVVEAHTFTMDKLS